MEPRDFYADLVTALQTSKADERDQHLFVKAAVALRNWYRHLVVLEKPELVVTRSAALFEVYGNVRLVRRGSGELALFHGAKNYSLSVYDTKDLGRTLALHARGAIQAEYLARTQAMLTASGMVSLRQRLESVAGYAHENLTVNWWNKRCTLKDAERILSRLMWDCGILDREAFGMAVRVGGFRNKATLYNQCIAQREALLARIKEAPHMAPWLYNEQTKRLSTHQTVWQDLKRAFLSGGGTPQGWKWLCNQGARWFRCVKVNDGSHVQVVNGLAALQMGKVPMHHGFYLQLVQKQSNPFFHKKIGDYLGVYKAAAVAHKKRKLKVSDFESYNLIFDWLRLVDGATSKGATWASLMRKQNDWHAEEVRRQVEQRKQSGVCYEWAPLVQSVQLGDLEAESLNTSEALWEEGKTQQHCVGGYDEPCYRNRSRIYSIRRAGSRVATMELRITDGKMTIGQLYGPRNSAIKDKNVTLLARRVVSACKRAAALDGRKATPTVSAPAQPHAYELIAPQRVEVFEELLDDCPF